MKRLIASVLCGFVISCALVACGDEGNKDGPKGLQIPQGVFPSTDQSALDGIVTGMEGFRSEIKKLSGVELTFPEIVTSVGLPGSSVNGAEVSYSGMLLSGGENLNDEAFEAVIAALTPQLTGYTKGSPIKGNNATKVQWVKNDDPTKYFEIVLSDYSGTTWVDFSFCYTDRTLLVEWPASAIDTFVGAPSGLPAYSGNYRDLETEHNAENTPDEFRIELDDADEEEFNAYLESLVGAGFTKEEIVDEYTSETQTQYTKMVNEGTYLTVVGSFWTWSGSYIDLIKDVYENLDWPLAALADAYGEQVANAIPKIEKAAKRSFVFEASDDELTIENNVSMELYDAYIQELEQKGFSKTYSSTYSSFVTYSITFENWDELNLSVEYVEGGYSDESYLRIDINFKEYTGFGVSLPENVEIAYQTTYTINNKQGNPSETRIVKIGESYYVSGDYMNDYYYLFDDDARTWTVYRGTADGDGTVNWSVEEENQTRASIDTKLKNTFSTLRLNTSAKLAEPQQSASVVGVSCVKYGFTMSIYNYEYWVNESTGLVFKYSCTYEGGATENVITEYDPSVTSFGNLQLPQ